MLRYRSNFYGSTHFDEHMRYNFPGNYTIAKEVGVLVLWGADDSAFNNEANLAGIPRYAPHARIVTFKQTGHWIAHERAAEVAAEINTFTAL